MPSERVIIALCTVPDESTASLISRALITERHAACVNILPQITSIYEWQGNLESSSELLLLIKTTDMKYSALEKAIEELHPYELPEIICFPAEGGLESYLNWVRSCVGPRA